MVVSSRTPEGQPHLCRICGELVATEASDPLDDSTCPKCGSWLGAFRDGLNLGDLHFDDELSTLSDSLDAVEIAMELEEEFHINIAEDLDSLKTIADLIGRIRQRMPERGEDQAA